MASKSKNNRLLKPFSCCRRAAPDRAADRTICSFTDIYSDSSGQQLSWLRSMRGERPPSHSPEAASMRFFDKPTLRLRAFANHRVAQRADAGDLDLDGVAVLQVFAG